MAREIGQARQLRQTAAQHRDNDLAERWLKSAIIVSEVRRIGERRETVVFSASGSIAAMRNSVVVRHLRFCNSGAARRTRDGREALADRGFHRGPVEVADGDDGQRVGPVPVAGRGGAGRRRARCRMTSRSPIMSRSA
ncbi:MAG: hypothetical protein IPI34_14245 [bacterium]|nr:hypothetical protein [bacterium]